MSEQSRTSDHLIVSAAEAGDRLDRYLTRWNDSLSRSYIQQLIADGNIQVNQRPARPAQPVRAGDQITLSYPPRQTTDLQPEVIPLDIIYEDPDIVIVNKAAGMVVHPAPGHDSGTLVHALLARYPDMEVNGTLRPGIVHRLDQGTSGLLVVARRSTAMHYLTEQQKAQKMHKAYLAVVEGRLKRESGTISAPIGRHPVDRKRQAIVAHGRSATTHYRVLEALGNYTLVEAVLETGRTHQIRVHFAAQHHPVLADALYGPRKPRASFGLQRQFLHAYRLGLYHPADQTWREFTAPLPEDLEDALDRLRKTVP
ncbi:MAG: RluA family pseudouridine synthase [Chloroflexaceae bacterium]|nr:RluA family pseudouridine synthase [Chloroflexaceae bacterium]